MAKGKYEGTVIGVSPWEVTKKETGEKMSGISYLVLVCNDPDEKFGMPTEAQVVYVSTPDKQLDKAIKAGAHVVFEGEYQQGFGGKPGKMKYTGMKQAKA